MYKVCCDTWVSENEGLYGVTWDIDVTPCILNRLAHKFLLKNCMRQKACQKFYLYHTYAGIMPHACFPFPVISAKNYAGIIDSGLLNRSICNLYNQHQHCSISYYNRVIPAAIHYSTALKGTFSYWVIIKVQRLYIPNCNSDSIARQVYIITTITLAWADA